MGTRSPLDQVVVELTAPPVNLTEATATRRCCRRDVREVNSAAIGQKGSQSQGRNGMWGCLDSLQNPSAGPVFDPQRACTKYLMEGRILSISINFKNGNITCKPRSAQTTNVQLDEHYKKNTTLELALINRIGAISQKLPGVPFRLFSSPHENCFPDFYDRRSFCPPFI